MHIKLSTICETFHNTHKMCPKLMRIQQKMKMFQSCFLIRVLDHVTVIFSRLWSRFLRLVYTSIFQDPLCQIQGLYIFTKHKTHFVNAKFILSFSYKSSSRHNKTQQTHDYNFRNSFLHAQNLLQEKVFAGEYVSRLQYLYHIHHNSRCKAKEANACTDILQMASTGCS